MFGLLCLFACDTTSPDFNLDLALTMQDIYEAPITSLVDDRLSMTGKLAWTEYRVVDLWTGVADDTLRARRPVLVFENGDQYIEERFRGRGRPNITLISTEFTKQVIEVNGEPVEHFRYGKRLIDRSAQYYLIGVIQYRDYFDPPPIDNPVFIDQSNDPTYWSQTFEIQLMGLAKVD